MGSKPHPHVKEIFTNPLSGLRLYPRPHGAKISVQGKKVLVLSDLKDPHANLGKMIERFKNSLMDEVKAINLHQVDIKGGCLGCLNAVMIINAPTGIKMSMFDSIKIR